MRFTSLTAVVVALFAFGSTSVLAHEAHAQNTGPSHSQDSVALLRRYFEENGYTAREIMDEYKLFRRGSHGTVPAVGTPRRKSSLTKLVTGAVRHSDDVVKLASVVPMLRNSGSGVSSPIDSSMSSFSDDSTLSTS